MVITSALELHRGTKWDSSPLLMCPLKLKSELEASEDIGIIWLVALPVPLHQGYHASFPHASEPSGTLSSIADYFSGIHCDFLSNFQCIVLSYSDWSPLLAHTNSASRPPSYPKVPVLSSCGFYFLRQCLSSYLIQPLSCSNLLASPPIGLQVCS